MSRAAEAAGLLSHSKMIPNNPVTKEGHQPGVHSAAHRITPL
jgi:hypothetical protein